MQARVERAAGMQVIPLGGQRYRVISPSGYTYIVDRKAGTCTCPDYQYRIRAAQQTNPRAACKHLIAVRYGDKVARASIFLPRPTTPR